MAESGEAALMMAAPEVGVPLIAAQAAATHGKPIFGGILIAISILFIIIAIIIISTAKSSGTKTAGWMFFVLSLGGLGFGGYLIAHEKKKRA
jgi:hypothetical protein